MDMRRVVPMDASTAQLVAEIDLVTLHVRLGGGLSGNASSANSVAQVFLTSEPPDHTPSFQRLASQITSQVPATDVDSDQLIEVSITFFDEPSPRAVISAPPDALSQDEVEFLRDSACRAIQESTDDGTPDLLEAANKIDNLPLIILRRRLTAIEAAVRAALSDAHLSSADVDALTGYAERLAIVHRLARDIDEPTVVKRPPPARDRYALAFSPPAINFFWKWAQSVGDDALTATTRLSMLISSQSVVAARQQAQETERFQRTVTIVGATILVPSLVAGIFGANVQIPGEGERYGFGAMLLLMVAGTLGALGLLRLSEAGLLRAGPRVLHQRPALSACLLLVASLIAGTIAVARLA